MTLGSVFRVLIVEDEILLAMELQEIIEEAGHQVVGHALDSRAACRMVDELQPDVVIMDLNMPDMGGVEAIRRITHGNPRVAILVLTMLADDDSVFAALRVGARGYLLKGARQAQIVRAVQTMAEGGDGNLRYKLSKESASKTLSLLFQDNFSGRAEVGLTGDDDFHLKVSADGSSCSPRWGRAAASGSSCRTAGSRS